MPVEPIARSALALDLSPRFAVYTTVDASPSAASETVVATLTIANFANIAVVSGVWLSAWLAFTVGTSGANVTLKIRQTNISGTVVATTGVLTGGVAAGNLLAQDVEGFDSGAGKLSYCVTLTVGSAAAASTVSAAVVKAIVV